MSSHLYQVRHVTRYRYESPVSESVLEVRKCPLSGGQQRCLNFTLEVKPHATVFSYDEAVGNKVHHFDLPQPHQEMSVTAESLVEVKDFPELPSFLPYDQWEKLEGEVPDLYQYKLPSPLVRPTRLLMELYERVKPKDGEDPLSFVRRLNGEIYSLFDYVPLSTQVDSVIDEALEARQGVCQDFAHIMVGLSRYAGVPARYVSGYLFHQKDAGDRSSRDASHAWMEAYFPEFGWVGFDPTNNLLAEERHIRTCIGRDYKDVPPTRGVYRGQSASELSVAVQVHPADLPNADDEFRRMDESDFSPDSWLADTVAAAQQQQQ